MEIYNHFEYGKRIASTLKAIDHHQGRKRFFEAHGLEDLFELEEVLSSVNGTILIAVDGCESESNYNRADGVMDTRHYAYIIASPTIGDQPASITAAIDKSRKLCKQVRNLLLHDPDLMGYLNRNTEMNGIGPIGDNFYGCMLSFSIDEPDDLQLNPDDWKK